MQRKQVQLLSVVITTTGLILGGCQSDSRRTNEVYVDLDRASLHFPGTQAITLLQRQAADLNDWQTPSLPMPGSRAVRLPAVDSPPPTDLFIRRREQALQALQEQREAVRISMLEASLQRLHALEKIWRKELEDDLDFEPIRQKWQEDWRALFERMAAQLFPLMVERELHTPSSDHHNALTARIQTIEKAWMAAELSLQNEREQQILRLKDEAEIRLGVRAREFITQAELEAIERLRDQPALAAFAPPIHRKQKASERLIRLEVPKPSKSIGLDLKVEQFGALWREKIKKHMQRLVQDWTKLNRYRLSPNRSAPDKTNEFILFLQGQ